MAKRKNKTPKQPQAAFMVPAELEWYEDETGSDAPGTKDDKPKGKSDGPTIDELTQQIANLNGQISAMQMQSAPSSQTQTRQRPQPKFDVNDLPDPMDDPKAYAAAIAEKTQAYMTDVQAAAQAEAQQSEQTSGKVNQLWRKFSTKYEDYADDFDKVEIAAERVAKRAAEGGIDLNRYMFGNSDKFVDDVAAEMETFFGMKPSEADDDNNVPDDDDDDRTVGIFGGAESGGKPAKRAKPAAVADDMFGDLRQWQTESGFHR